MSGLLQFEILRNQKSQSAQQAQKKFDELIKMIKDSNLLECAEKPNVTEVELNLMNFKVPIC